MSLVLAIVAALSSLFASTPAEPVVLAGCEVSYERSLFAGYHHVAPFGDDTLEYLGAAELACATGEITSDELAGEYRSFMPEPLEMYIVSQARGYYREL
jgi:hypothetical protein